MRRWFQRRSTPRRDWPIDVRLEVKDAALLRDEEPGADLIVIVSGTPLLVTVSCAIREESPGGGWGGRDLRVWAHRSGRTPRGEVRLPYTREATASTRLELSGFPPGRHEFVLELRGARDDELAYRRRLIVQSDGHP